jgi:hypothetical protein
MYLDLLEHSYQYAREWDPCPPETRAAFLSVGIFDFTTYDGAMDDLFGGRAVQVCDAINFGKTFEYIKDPENYKWFLLMVNMPFFYPRLEWGTSIRGAWWEHGKVQRLDSCFLYEGDEQKTDWEFTRDEWQEFIAAVVAFGSAAGAVSEGQAMPDGHEAKPAG